MRRLILSRKTGFLIFVSMFLVMVPLMTTVPVRGNGAHEIVIGVVEGKLEFNVTEISVEKGEIYTVIFVNEDAGSYHNVIIDTNDNAASDTVNDTADILIGPENDNASSEAGGGVGKSWNVTWTAPNEDKWVTYYCGYTGHYATMKGKFKVGNPKSAPGFEFFTLVIPLLGLAGLRLRRN